MKIKYLALLMVLLALAAPFALADNNTNSTQGNETVVDDDDGYINDTDVEVNDTDEIECMMTSEGAEVRLLQLAKSIERNILMGEEILDAANFTENVTTALNEQLNVLKGLLVDVKAIDLERTPSELAEAFVEIKKEAIDAAKEFRDLARGTLGEMREEQVREIVHERSQERVEELKQQIRERKNGYNAWQIKTLYQRMGLAESDVDEELIGRIRSGDADWKEVSKKLQERIKNMRQEQKEDLALQLKENAIKKRIFAHDITGHNGLSNGVNLLDESGTGVGQNNVGRGN